MDIQSLRYFLAIAQEESVSKAAIVLHMTQPPLSRQLHSLEEELGKPLFIRGSRRLTLTQDGILLRKRAEEILELVEKTTIELREPADGCTGEISIGGGESDGMRIAAQAIHALRKKHPNVCCHLYSGNTEDVAERIDRGLLDFGILIAPADRKKYDRLELPASDRWGLLMRTDSPLASQASIRPPDLMGIPIIAPRQLITNRELSRWIEGGIHSLQIIGTYNLLLNASLLVEEGIGCALCMDKLVVASARNKLCFRPLEPAVDIQLELVWKKDQLFAKAASLFLEEMQTLVCMMNDRYDAHKTVMYPL